MEHWTILFRLHHHPPAAASQTRPLIPICTDSVAFVLTGLTKTGIPPGISQAVAWGNREGFPAPASPWLSLGLTGAFRHSQFLLSEKQRQDCDQTFPSPLLWSQVSPDLTKTLSFSAPSHWNHVKSSPKAASPEAFSSWSPCSLEHLFHNKTLSALPTFHSASRQSASQGGRWGGSRTHGGSWHIPLRDLSVA